MLEFPALSLPHEVLGKRETPKFSQGKEGARGSGLLHSIPLKYFRDVVRFAKYNLYHPAGEALLVPGLVFIVFRGMLLWDLQSFLTPISRTHCRKCVCSFFYFASRPRSCLLEQAHKGSSFLSSLPLSSLSLCPFSPETEPYFP